ncbi:pathogenicity island protein [Staphylococcus condimenti]|nr:pathogenicity island protein [Staphylococcus condimenti]
MIMDIQLIVAIKNMNVVTIITTEDEKLQAMRSVKNLGDGRMKRYEVLNKLNYKKKGGVYEYDDNNQDTWSVFFDDRKYRKLLGDLDNLLNET